MYATLTKISLLQGISAQDLIKMEDKLNIKPVSLKNEQKALIQEHQECRELIFLVHGKLRKETQSLKGQCKAIEYVQAPNVIEPEKLYGIHCRYESTYYPQNNCEIIRIDKWHVGQYLMQIEVFRLNYLNYLSSLIHHQKKSLQRPIPNNVTDKVIAFLMSRFQHYKGEKRLFIRMNDLADHIDETRLSVSQVLNRMKEEGILQLKRKEINIPDLKQIEHFQYESTIK